MLMYLLVCAYIFLNTYVSFSPDCSLQLNLQKKSDKICIYPQQQSYCYSRLPTCHFARFGSWRFEVVVVCQSVEKYVYFIHHRHLVDSRKHYHKITNTEKMYILLKQNILILLLLFVYGGDLDFSRQHLSLLLVIIKQNSSRYHKYLNTLQK